MNSFLILCFDAPLIAFGGAIVDNHGVIREFPALSMIAGLLGNALGFEHGDSSQLQALQDSLLIATRWDRKGKAIVDYQTVDLGQSFLMRTGWTTHGKREIRTGGVSSKGTHIRNRHYRTDCIYTCSIMVSDSGGDFSLDCIEKALLEPARPLFLGRKCCLPSRPVFSGRIEAASLRDALEKYPRDPERADTGPLPAWWPVDGPDADANVFPVSDLRDWRNQIHCGRRFVARGFVNPKESVHE